MDVINLQNAQLIGQTKFKAWKDKFNAEWNRPNAELIKAQMWHEIHPLVKEELAKRIPQTVKNMNQKYGE